MTKTVRIALLFTGALLALAGTAKWLKHKWTLSLLLILWTASASWAAGLQWGVCPPPPPWLPDAGQECATLQVPLDYRAPHGRQIVLALSRVRSGQPDLRRGVVLMNPGGPGAPGLDLPRLVSAVAPQNVLDRYDLIGFDPRFVGLSTPLTCGLSRQEAIQVDAPPAGFPTASAFMREVADRCHGTSGDVLPFATTANTARDMDRIREALGESKISYYGPSYGSYLGAVYASLFPNRTDRFVLDSALHPHWVWRRALRSFGPGGELRFPDFANFAAAHDDTYHLGDTREKIRRLFLELVDRLGADPCPLPDGTLLNGALFRFLVFAKLYRDANFPQLAAAFQELNDSSCQAAGALKVLSDDVPSDNGTALRLAVWCSDVAWPRSVRTYRRALISDSNRYPLFGSLGSNISPCAFWHDQPIEPPVPISATGPPSILILQNLRDPATPFEGALGMRYALGERARIVVVDQGDHGVYLVTPNACGNAIATAFLAEGTLPEGDVFCPAEKPAQLIPAAGSARERAIKEWMRRLRW